MLTTRTWAQTHGISSAPDLSAVPGYTEPCARSANEIATRAIILQGVVAVACHVDPVAIVEWFREQGVWEHVTQLERSFLQTNIEGIEEGEVQRNRFRWHQEAEWTLLWTVGKIDTLGLPTKLCDTRRLVDEIIPPLGSNIQPFLSAAILRPPGALLAEDDRTYNLWCYALAARKDRTPFPADLNMNVLYERRYAFEWLDGMQDWDSVTCDS